MDEHVMIAAVVVLYNPDNKVLENIRTYIGSVQVLFAIDNSEHPRADFAADLVSLSDKIEYMPMHKNMGIAHALNVAAKIAVERRYAWLLTMDQDSAATVDMTDQMLACAHAHRESKVGLIGPYHWVDPEQFYPGKAACEEILSTMTSGNLLSLSAFREVGSFREDFFIGYVDHEYCLRLRKNGFAVLQCNRAVLIHELGKTSKHRVLFARISTTNHSPMRLYYRTRNRLQTIKLYRQDYPEFAKHEVLAILKELMKIAIFERDSLLKLKFIFKGYVHFKKKIFGMYLE